MDDAESPAPPQAGTRLYTLLHSNEPPDSSEIAVLQSTSSRIDARLDVLDQEITRLKQLTEERALLVSYGIQNKGILSPMRRMPNEVLVEIFGLCVPSVKFDGLWACRFSMRRAPWVFTRVCRLWRTVALETPGLWAQLVLYCRGFCQPLEAIRAQVERTGGLHIHFGLTCEEGDDGEDSDEEDDYDRFVVHSQADVFQYITQSSARWEELNLLVTPKLVPLLPLLRRRLPSLRRLWLKWEEDDSQKEDDSQEEEEEEEEEEEPFDYFQTADSLVHLGVNRDVGIRVGEPYPITIVAPPNQLTRYCADASWATHRGILSASPTLIEAHINIIVSDMPDPWPVSGETFHLPQLQRLYISDSKPLPNFQVPVLEQLTLGMGAQRHGTSQRHRQPVTRGLDGFIANTPTIRKLGFMGGTDQHFVLTILKKFPHIEELAVIVKWTWEDTRVDSDGDESGGDSDGESGGHGHGDGDWDPDQATRIFISSLFRPFFNNPRDTPLCPRLARIHLGIADDGSQAILSACLKMLESRWNLPDHGALEAATIVQSGVASPNGEMQNRIDALRAEGLQLAVSNEGTQVMRTMASWMCTTEWEEHKVPFREFEDMY